MVEGPKFPTWVWVKIKPPGDHRFLSMVSFTRVPFGVPICGPQPCFTNGFIQNHTAGRHQSNRELWSIHRASEIKAAGYTAPHDDSTLGEGARVVGGNKPAILCQLFGSLRETNHGVQHVEANPNRQKPCCVHGLQNRGTSSTCV